MADTAKTTTKTDTAGQAELTPSPAATSPTLLERAQKLLGSDGPWLYVGPTSPKLGMQKLKNYIELPLRVINALEKHPALRFMFVTHDKWNETRPQVVGGYKGHIYHAGVHLAQNKVFTD